MLSRDVINDVASCMNMFVCILHLTVVIMGVVGIFMALFRFARLNYYAVAGIL
jgi:hypothetical protein